MKPLLLYRHGAVALIIACAVALVGGCAEINVEPKPPVISDISDSHVKIQSNWHSQEEIEEVARRGCALYQRVPVYMSTQCGAFKTHPTPRECTMRLSVGAPGAVAVMNNYWQKECQRKLDYQRLNPTCVRNDHLYACTTKPSSVE